MQTITTGERLKELRIKQRMTQAELARRAGVQQSLVSMLETGERGKRPEFETVIKLARALEVPLDDLIV